MVKKLTSENLELFIDTYKTKHKEGFTGYEIETILEKYKIGVLSTEEDYENDSTVFDNLSDKDLNFLFLENGRPYDKKLNVSFYDYPYLYYIFSKCLLSNKRREYWF